MRVDLILPSSLSTSRSTSRSLLSTSSLIKCAIPSYALVSLMCICLIGCHEATNVPSVMNAGEAAGDSAGMSAGDSAGDSGGDSAGETVAGGRATGVEADRAIAERVAFVETALNPTLAYYAVGEPITLTLRSYDRYGELLPPPELVFTPRPDDAADVDYAPPPAETPLDERSPEASTATVTPTQEGQGAMRICVRRNPDICGRASYFVDNGPPVIELTTPQEDQVILGESERPEVEVSGRVSGQVALYVNEREVEVADDGTFSALVGLRFGYNTIEVTADDGFRRPLSRVLRVVLYAPETLSIDSGEVEIPAPMLMRIPPRLLDGPPPPPALMGAPVMYTDLANSLERILALLDPTSLAPTDLSSGALNLTISDPSIGQPEVDLITQDGALEAFVRLPELSVNTQGAFVSDALSLDLTGEVSVGVSAFVSLSPQVVDGELQLIPSAIGVALEEVRGVMADPTAQALLDTLTSALQLALSGWASGLIEELVEAELPRALIGQLDGALSLVSSIPFDVTDDSLGLSIVGELGLSLREDSLTLSAQSGVSASLDLTVRGPAPGSSERFTPPPELSGVPAHVIGEVPWPAQDEVALALPLAGLNTALYLVWAQGAFNIDLSERIPPPFDSLISGVSLSAPRPPLLVDTPVGDPHPLGLSIEGLTLTVNATDQVDPPDPTRSDEHRVSLYLPLGLTIDESNTEAPALTLDASASPQVRVALSRQGGARPVLDPALIERSVVALILPRLEELIADGLSVPIPRVDLNLNELLGVDPLDPSQPTQLSISPRFQDLLRVEGGWVVISSGLNFVIE